MFKNLSSPGKSLSSRAMKSSVWIFTLKITERLFQLIRTIVLARLLSPNDFGLFGIALLVLYMLETFTETGFQNALIQKKGEIRSFLDTAWTVGLIRGSVIAAIVFFLAEPASIFFNAPDAEAILRVICASIILHSLTNITVLYFQKELEFHKYFKYHFSGTIADIVVVIVSAVILRSVWALVLGLLAGNLVRCIMSYIIEPYKPKIRFNAIQARELFSFGKWVLGTSIVTFLFNHGDDGFVGKFLGVTTLGFYQIAFMISQLPATDYSKILSQVTFPVYSKVQEKPLDLKDSFLKTLNMTTIFIIPIAGGIFLLAPDFTSVFLGDKWAPIIPIMRILVFGGMARALITTGGALFQGIGIPRLDFKMNIIRLVTMIVAIYPLTVLLDIRGVALAVTIADFAPVPMWFAETTRITNASFKDYFKAIVFPFLGTVCLCLPIVFLKWWLEVNIFSFILMFLLGTGTYIAFLYMLERKFNYKVLKEFRSLIGLLLKGRN
jgi:lipopolysaccharide exporter